MISKPRLILTYSCKDIDQRQYLIRRLSLSFFFGWVLSKVRKHGLSVFYEIIWLHNKNSLVFSRKFRLSHFLRENVVVMPINAVHFYFSGYHVPLQTTLNNISKNNHLTWFYFVHQKKKIMLNYDTKKKMSNIHFLKNNWNLPRKKL